MKPKNRLSLIVAAAILLVPTAAFAQTSSDTSAAPFWVSLGGLVAGYLTHAYQTGEVFGQKTLPKAYVPYVGAAAAFGAGFLAALPAGSVSAAALEAATLGGLQGLAAMAFGVAGHVAQTAHKSSRGVEAMASGNTATIPPAPPANDVKNGTFPAPPAAVFVLVLLLLQNQACISSAPIVPTTAANQAQIASCQDTATLHNGVVVGGFVLTGSTAGLAGVAAAEPDSNGSVKTALGVAGAVAGGLAVVAAAMAELSNSNFQNSQCASVVGPLPTAPAPDAVK